MITAEGWHKFEQERYSSGGLYPGTMKVAWTQLIFISDIRSIHGIFGVNHLAPVVKTVQMYHLF